MSPRNATTPTDAGPDASSADGPFSSVLVPLDGSPFGESVLPHVRAVARPGASQVRLLSVLDPELTGGNEAGCAEMRLQAVEAETYLEGVAERLRDAGLDVEVEVLTGRPGEEIVRAADRTDADLVALAARPRRSEAHLVSRGVARAVMAAGVASLLVARGDAGERLPALWREARYRRVLVPEDGSPPSDRALELAADVARCGEAEVVTVRVEPGERSEERGGAGSGVGARAGAPAGSWHVCLDRVEDRPEGANGVAERRSVRCAGIPQAVAEVAAEVEPDLVVFAAHGEGGAEGTYGHCARWLLLHADAPILVYQDRPRRPLEAGADRPGIRRRRRIRPGAHPHGRPGVPAGSTA